MKYFLEGSGLVLGLTLFLQFISAGIPAPVVT